MRILTAEAMQKVDREAIEGFGIPSLVLMENAALGVVDAVAQEYPTAESVVIFCGPGNNGGDGLAIARHLAVRGYGVTVLLLSGDREIRGDAAVQLGICRGMDLALRDVDASESIAALIDEASDADVIVDALFGTGLARPLSGHLAELVSALNRMPTPRVAVDLPSGLNGSRSDVFGPAFEADLTVTFAAPKIAHIFPPAAAYAGRVVVADLGIPQELVHRAEGDLHLATEEDLAHLIVPRALDAHKGDFGHVLVVAGSEGKSGAAILTAQGAVRSGSGLVTVACPSAVLSTVEGASVESMAIALPTLGPGLDLVSVELVHAALDGKSSLAIGPGLGAEGDTGEAVRRIVRDARVPVVIDADGLNAYAGRLEELSDRRAETVLTPHPGELARLMGSTVEEVLRDRLGTVRRACAESGAVVVLKGHLSLVADPLGGVYVNPTGNPGMATGGCGDVLTGMIAGLRGQGGGLLESVRLAVFLHGMAGDLAADRVGEAGLAASDVLHALPGAVERLARP